MRRFLFPVLLVLFLLGTWHPAEAVETLKPYDNFLFGLVNPDRWVGSQAGSGVREASRTIIQDSDGRHLRILNRAYGETDSDAGTSFGGFAFAFKNPSTITAIGATMQVRNFKSTGCPSNPTPTFAIPGIFGAFFNVGTPVPGSRVDDVFAAMSVARLSSSTDPPNILDVSAVVIHCHNDDCSASTTLGVAPLGKATKGQWVRLLMQWDQANHQFIFQRGKQTPVLVPYSVSDTAEPGFPLKTLEVVHRVANCTTAPRPVGMGDALFDNVVVNESALP